MTIDISKASDMELACFVGRIPEGAVSDNDFVKQLMKNREEAITELKKRTGFDKNRLNQYIQDKLKEQEEMWGNQWEEISKEGSVFTYREKPAVLETIRKYLTPSEMAAKEVILARIRGTSQFTYFDEVNTPLLVKLGTSPIYTDCTPEERGLIKAHEKPEQREKGEPVQSLEDWKKFDDLEGVVFYHRGFDETFEVLKKYGLPNRERNIENEVLLARSHKRPVFAEFTLLDTLLMEITSNVHPRFNSGNAYDLEK